MKITATTILQVEDLGKLNMGEEKTETIRLRVRLPDQRIYPVTMGNNRSPAKADGL